MMKKFYAILKARTMEYVRDRGSFFWNLIFPFLLVAGFAFAFSGENDPLFKVGTLGVPSDVVTEKILENPAVDWINYEGDVPLEKLRRHQLDMVIDFDNNQYYLNSESVSASLLRELVQATGAPLQEEQITGKAIRYVDWLVPGVIAMNMLFSCLFGVGFVIVRYRKNGVLKRLKASPVTPLTFITAQMVSRFIIVFLTSLVVYMGTNVFLKFMMNGSYLLLVLLLALGILCMISLGLVFASRIRNEELAGGLINLVTFPMMIFSGIFFSLEGTPVMMQRVSNIFPLTHLLTAARAVMLDGAGLVQVGPQILILTVMTAGFLLIASLLFKWE